MFHHISLLRFRPDSTPDQHQAVVDALRALPTTIGSLVEYEVHLDAGLSEGNAHVSIAATFADEDGWRLYTAHADHVRVLEERIVPILESGLRSQHGD